MFILLTAHAAARNNKMQLSRTVIDGVPVFVPTSRIKLVEDAIKGKIVSFKGDKESLSRLSSVFKYALHTEKKIQPAANNRSIVYSKSPMVWETQKKYDIRWENDGSKLEKDEMTNIILSNYTSNK